MSSFDSDVNESSNNSFLNTTESNDESINFLVSNSNNSSKLAGGAKIVSLLRSKYSGSIDSKIELNEYLTSRNFMKEHQI